MKWLELIAKIFPALCAGIRLLTGRRPNKGSILVIEDDPHDQVWMMKCLEKLGYACKIAADAPEANALMEAWSFDVVFVDLLLPGVSGPEFLQDLYKRCPGSKIIIVCTDPGLLSPIEPGRNWAFIKKPVNPAVLKEVLRRTNE
jgi:CheY-like chemotaxis protein